MRLPSRPFCAILSGPVHNPHSSLCSRSPARHRGFPSPRCWTSRCGRLHRSIWTVTWFTIREDCNLWTCFIHGALYKWQVLHGCYRGASISLRFSLNSSIEIMCFCVNFNTSEIFTWRMFSTHHGHGERETLSSPQINVVTWKALSSYSVYHIMITNQARRTTTLGPQTFRAP